MIADLAALRIGVASETVLEGLLARESQGSTGIGHGVAVPHARLDGLNGMAGVFLKLEPPVEFDSMDGRPVDLLFALFAPKGAGADHLRALARVSRQLREPELREQLRRARTEDALYALLAREPSSNAA